MHTPGHFTDLAQGIEARFNKECSQKEYCIKALELIKGAATVEEARMIADNALSVLGVQHGAEEGKQ